MRQSRRQDQNRPPPANLSRRQARTGPATWGNGMPELLAGRRRYL